MTPREKRILYGFAIFMSVAMFIVMGALQWFLTLLANTSLWLSLLWILAMFVIGYVWDNHDRAAEGLPPRSFLQCVAHFGGTVRDWWLGTWKFWAVIWSIAAAVLILK